MKDSKIVIVAQQQDALSISSFSLDSFVGSGPGPRHVTWLPGASNSNTKEINLANKHEKIFKICSHSYSPFLSILCTLTSTSGTSTMRWYKVSLEGRPLFDRILPSNHLLDAFQHFEHLYILCSDRIVSYSIQYGVETTSIPFVSPLTRLLFSTILSANTDDEQLDVYLFTCVNKASPSSSSSTPTVPVTCSLQRCRVTSFDRVVPPGPAVGSHMPQRSTDNVHRPYLVNSTLKDVIGRGDRVTGLASKPVPVVCVEPNADSPDPKAGDPLVNESWGGGGFLSLLPPIARRELWTEAFHTRTRALRGVGSQSLPLDDHSTDRTVDGEPAEVRATVGWRDPKLSVTAVQVIIHTHFLLVVTSP